MANKNRTFFPLVVLLGSLVMVAQPQEQVIEEIALIEGQGKSPSVPPPRIRIGLEAACSAFFKLLDKGNVIQAGLLVEGLNSISLPAPALLEKSGSHTYILELKTETGLLQHEILLDIQIAQVVTVEQKADPQVPGSEHTVSLFFKGERIASLKKKLDQKRILPEKESPLPRNYDPFNPDPNDNPFVNSVDIFQAAGFALQVIKDLVKKKDEGEDAPSIQKVRQLFLDFRRKNPQGEEEQIRATIRLSTRILRLQNKGSGRPKS